MSDEVDAVADDQSGTRFVLCSQDVLFWGCDWVATVSDVAIVGRPCPRSLRLGSLPPALLELFPPAAEFLGRELAIPVGVEQGEGPLRTARRRPLRL